MPNNIILRTLEFYTDGAYSSRSLIGGWSCVCVEDNAILASETGHELNTTNNRMELTGFLCALQSAATVSTSRAKITIYSDSAYICNCLNDGWYRNWMSNGWRTSDKRPVKNQDLWLQIIALWIRNKDRFTDFQVQKVQGHSNNKWNKVADMYAVKARTTAERESENENSSIDADGRAACPLCDSDL